MIAIHPRSLAATILGAVAAVAALGGCGDDPAAPVDAPPAPTDAAPRLVVSADRTLLVGEIAEGILAGGAGDRAVIRVTAPLAKLIDDSFEPTAQADWYLLLRNKDTAPMAVDVDIELYGNLQWSGWQ